MEVSYSTMIAAGNLVKRLAQNARRLEKALAETMNTSAEWKRIADELKAERNALRSTTIDTAAGRLLDAFGSLTNEPRNGAPDDEYRDRIVNKIHSIKMERDALRAECDDLRRVFALVHISLGIQQGEHIGNAIDALKKERDELATRLRQSIARGDFAEMRLATLAAELETERERHRQTAAVPQSVDVPRTHPVKVGESVRRTTEGSIAPIGTLGRVLVVWSDAYQVELRKGFSTMWAFDDCTPCDPPPEASHITPEGKQTAEGALPQPGDVVRLVRVPTVKDCSKYDFQDSEQLRLISTQVNTMGKVVGTELCEACACVVDDTGTIKAWPLSCIEVVKGGEQ